MKNFLLNRMKYDEVAVLEDSDATFATIENFLAMEHYSLMVPIFIISMMVAMAARIQDRSRL